jgi:hypothetical protein
MADCERMMHLCINIKRESRIYKNSNTFCHILVRIMLCVWNRPRGHVSNIKVLLTDELPQ